MLLKRSKNSTMRTGLLLGLGLTCLTLVAAPLTMYMLQNGRTLQSVHLKRVGIAPLKALLRMVQLLQQHRGLSAGVLGGSTTVEAQRAAKQTETGKAVEAFDAIVTSDIHDPAVTAAWRRVLDAWRALANGVSSRSISGQESFVKHTVLIDDNLKLLELLLDYFGFSHDLTGHDHHITTALLVHMPPLTEFLGQARAHGMLSLGSKSMKPSDRIALLGSISNIERQYWYVADELGESAALNPLMMAELSGTVTAGRALMQKAADLARSQTVKVGVLRSPLAEYWAVFTQAIDAQFGLIDKGLAHLDGALQMRVAAVHNAQLRAIGFTVLATAFALWLGVMIIRTLKEDIAALERSEEAQRRAASELETTVEDRTRELRTINAQLEAASRHKSDFLANMSHELRTPLNGILGFSDLLQDPIFGPLNEKQARYLGHIHTSGKHLLALINDLLDLSKVEAGKLELRRETFNLAETLEAALHTIRPQAEVKGLALRLTVEPALPLLTADPLRLTQILYNLLSNAIKFTPEGGRVTVTAGAVGCAECRLRCAAFHASDSPEAIEIAVADTGIGITAEDMPKLFERFTQLDPTLAKQYHGTGLGLALTKQLVELHDGRIWAASDGAGHGSSFTIRLPLRLPT